jgi:hypothetical protein
MLEHLGKLAASALQAAPADIVDPKGEQIAAIIDGCSAAVVIVIFAGLLSGALSQMEDDDERDGFMALLNFMAVMLVEHEDRRREMH